MWADDQLRAVGTERESFEKSTEVQTGSRRASLSQERICSPELGESFSLLCLIPAVPQEGSGQCGVASRVSVPFPDILNEGTSKELNTPKPGNLS